MDGVGKDAEGEAGKEEASYAGDTDVGADVETGR